MKIGIIAMAANMVFNLMLAPFISYVGLALATSMSGALKLAVISRAEKSEYLSAIASYAADDWSCINGGNSYGGDDLVFAARYLAAAYQFIWVRAQAVGFVILAAVPVYFGVLGLLGVRLSHLKRQSVAENHE